MNTDNQTSDLNQQKVAEHLTQATQNLDRQTVSALQQARERSIEKQLLHRPALAFGSEHGNYHWLPHSPQQWFTLSIFALAILVGGINYWHHPESKGVSSPFNIASVHLDIAILTDDLPMEVFID
jgi:hypothetical protein